MNFSENMKEQKSSTLRNEHSIERLFTNVVNRSFIDVIGSLVDFITIVSSGVPSFTTVNQHHRIAQIYQNSQYYEN